VILDVESPPGNFSTAIIESAERSKEGVVGVVPEGGESQSGESIPMPGVIMENGDRNGSHTNHDRDRQPNGINGEMLPVEKGLEKGKGREPQQNMTPTSPTGPNIPNGMENAQLPSTSVIPAGTRETLKQLPPEIIHITEGYMPLSTLLTRFAQKTHNDLTARILEMAQMPVSASAINGNVSHASTDDNSAENVNKKHRLLEWAQNAHTDWTKAYVITSWSRNSEEVSKLIDLKAFLMQQSSQYGFAIGALAQVRRELGAAKIPNPDLKTAVQVLSTGKAPWMPEVCQVSSCPKLR
jgi:mediator of RNA polymerase II transcription subunit 14